MYTRTQYYKDFLLCERFLNQTPSPAPAPAPEEIIDLTVTEIVDLTKPKYYRNFHYEFAQVDDYLPITRTEDGYFEEVEPVTENEEIIIPLKTFNALVKNYNDLRRKLAYERCLSNMKISKPIKKPVTRSHSAPDVIEEISDFSDEEVQFSISLERIDTDSDEY